MNIDIQLGITAGFLIGLGIGLIPYAYEKARYKFEYWLNEE